MIERRPRVGFIGAGRVGKGLSLALSRCGYDIVGVATRSPTEKAKVLAAEIIFLTVPDDSLQSVCAELSFTKSQCVVHCSGAAELSVLDPARRAGALVGGFHPLQMFADPEIAARALRGCAIAVESGEPLAATLIRMVTDLGARPLRVPPGSRAAYHAAAHYAGPFVAALLAEAISVWSRLGIAEDDALAALLPLVRGSLDAIGRDGPARAMAGSVARGDVETLRRHIDALGALEPGFRQFYCRLALRTVPLAAASGKLDSVVAARIRELLSRGGEP